MNPEQQKAYEWAKNQNYQSVAAQYAKILADLIYSLQADLARMTAERDAAVRDLREAIFNDRTNSCSFCSHANQDPSAAPYCLANFCENDEWEWRGVQQAGK